MDMMHHYTWFYLTQPLWNNVFCYQERLPNAKLRVAPLQEGTIKDLKVWSQTAFVEKSENWWIQYYTGVESFIKVRESNVPIYIFDNHNHALYFWYKEAEAQGIGRGTLDLIHIDQHSDLNENPFSLEAQHLDQIFDFVQMKCNVGNFIKPALENWFINTMQQIRSEYGLLQYENHYQNYILDLDLDFWADEMGIEQREETIRKTKNLILWAKVVTIATSPYFLEQEQAIKILYALLEN